MRHYGETYGLPVVILSTRTSHGRGLPRARELPAAPRHTPPIIDGETLQPVDPPVPPGFVRITGPIPVCSDCYSRPRIPAPIADAARRAPQGSRFLAFVGRVFPGAELVILENARGADDLADRATRQPVIETTATEVR